MGDPSSDVGLLGNAGTACLVLWALSSVMNVFCAILPVGEPRVFCFGDCLTTEALIFVFDCFWYNFFA